MSGDGGQVILELARALHRGFPWPLHLKPQRERIPDDVRKAVMRRDDYRCRRCGRQDDVVLDHVWPWILGGCDDASNLQALCWDCNQAKSGDPPLGGMLRRVAWWTPVLVATAVVIGVVLGMFILGPGEVVTAVARAWGRR